MFFDVSDAVDTYIELMRKKHKQPIIVYANVLIIMLLISELKDVHASIWSFLLRNIIDTFAHR